MTTRPLSNPEVRKVSVFFVLLWAVIHTVLLHLTLNFELDISIADAAINTILLAAACIGTSNMLGYYMPKTNILVYILIITTSLSAIVVFGSYFILNNLFVNATMYVSFYKFSMLFRFLLCLVCLSWCAWANILWYRLEEQAEMQKRFLTAQNLAKEAELNKLRHQLQPHFLFNSLNSVFALTMINPTEAGTMITKLASFLRGTLKREDDLWLTVREEIEYIQLYLDIEKVRFSHRLNIILEVEEETKDFKLPGTFLQPIIENAIKFGLYNTSRAITIEINVTKNDQLLQVQVKNPFDPDQKNTGGTGFGLNSIKRRLYLLFANTDLIQTHVESENTFVTTLKIPQIDDQSHIN